MSTDTDTHDDKEVKPGDLITADLINDILERLEELEEDQDSGHLPVIDDVYTPPNPGNHMSVVFGEEVTIVGKNLKDVVLIRFDTQVVDLPSGPLNDTSITVTAPSKPDSSSDYQLTEVNLTYDSFTLGLLSVSNDAGTGTRVVACYQGN